ncbi:MAG TPA: outer membrane beta-barrel protein [Gemmatimonadales bacterium]|jgi:hypothetical protein
MKRFGLALLAVALCVVAARPAMAQGTLRYGVNAGLLLPMGDYADQDKLGWIAGAGATYWLPGNIGIRGDLSYSSTAHDGVGATGSTKLIGGMASVVYALMPASAPARLMVTGGVGYYNIDFGGGLDKQSKIGFGGGAALAFKMGTGSTRLVVATRYTSVSTDGTSRLNFLPITVGLTFGK